MTWLATADCEVVRHIVRQSSAMYLVSTLDGRILWANPAFCEWSKYSLAELTRLTWMQLSVDDDDLQADIKSAGELTEYSLSYMVQKRYVPKNDKPQLGNLYVTRFPATGEIKFCVCRWEPLVNGTAQAFELALESQKKLLAQMTELTKAVEVSTSQTDEQKFTLSIVAMVAKHPKVAFSIAVLILGAGGFDTILNTLQRLGYVSQPPVVVKEVTK